MYRIYDTKEKKWVRKYNLYLNPIGDMFISNPTIFGNEKMQLLSDDRYVLHNWLGMHDKNHINIYEGDFVSVDETDVVGLIAYIPELASYKILEDETSLYYSLSDKMSDRIEVIGNVFEPPVKEESAGDNE
nr:MAG TPA: YopX protein [Caudoviricetes sp.]